VGKTINLKERYRTHCKPNSGGGKKISNYLKYIRNNKAKPILEIIDYTEDADWSWLEKYWISQLRAWGFNLLNSTEGGEKQYHFTHTEESKKLISDKQKGRKLSKEWCNNISKGKLGVGFSNEHLLNLSKSHLGIPNIQAKKSVYKLNEKFEILKKYNSITEALKDNNINTNVGTISKVCKGKLKSTLGYHWCYVDDYNNLDINKFKKSVQKSVLKIDIKTENIIKIYDSVKSASIDNKCNPSAISHVCNDRRGSVKNFIYVFENDYDINLIKDIKKTILKKYTLQMIDLKTNKLIRTFSSIKEAELLLNIKHISHVCSGERKQAGGFIWKKLI
jgi:hypothetical protein